LCGEEEINPYIVEVNCFSNKLFSSIANFEETVVVKNEMATKKFIFLKIINSPSETRIKKANK